MDKNDGGWLTTKELLDWLVPERHRFRCQACGEPMYMITVPNQKHADLRLAMKYQIDADGNRHHPPSWELSYDVGFNDALKLISSNIKPFSQWDASALLAMISAFEKLNAFEKLSPCRKERVVRQEGASQ